VATNWDPRLIEEFAKYPVRDIYGVADHTIIGSARPSFLLTKVSDEQIADYIKKVHEKKMKFSYAINAPCMNNMEYDKEHYRKLVEYLQWVKDLGTDSVIITTPFLIQLVKEQFPTLKIRVSTIAHVNSVNRAKLFEMMGADEITPDVMINRDFKTLEKMQKAVKCELVLLLTDGCLYQCPFRHYHYNILGHASQTYNEFERYYIDFCIINCGSIKFSDPTEIIKCRWIRPEDLTHYEDIGIDHFKIAGRRMSTEWIINSVKAFSSRKYDGNLVDIIQGFSFTFGDVHAKDPNVGFVESVGKESKANLLIDNTKLDGFIEFFKKQNCIAMCDECNYCEEWAKKTIVLDPDFGKDYVDSLNDYISNIVSGREFGMKSTESQEEKKGFEWNVETQQIFDKLIELSPPEFQSMAQMMISQLAEGNAKKRGSGLVEHPDMIIAFLEGTPAPFQADMREGLKKYGLKFEE
jgi:collagenase-like PrtC family protease